jgi:hypothetical protein
MSIKRIPKWVWWGLAVLIAFQIYLFRELVAAELLFAIAFAMLLIFVSAIYWIAVGADRGLGWIEANSHGVTERARQQLVRVEAISKRLSHRQHSTSAP